MRRAALGTIGFFFLAPGTVAGLLPWLITRWEGSPSGLDALDGLGLAVAAIGVLVVVVCFVQFVVEGRGTPAPVAPTEQLVVHGVYRFVRNPMYLGVSAAIAGQAVAFRSGALGLLLAVFVAAVTAFVAAYEEPTLRKQFGESYDGHVRAVPRWLPKWPG